MKRASPQQLGRRDHVYCVWRLETVSCEHGICVWLLKGMQDTAVGHSEEGSSGVGREAGQ